MKSFKEFVTEGKKMTPTDVVRLFKNTKDWGDDLKGKVRVTAGNLEVVESWYYGEARAMESLIKGWTDPKGSYAKYFKEEYGITFKLVDKFSQVKAEGRYKKITKDGIVGVILKMDQKSISEAKDEYTDSATNLFFDKDSGEKVKVRSTQKLTFVKDHPNGTVEFKWDGKSVIAKQGSLANMARRGLIRKV